MVLRGYLVLAGPTLETPELHAIYSMLASFSGGEGGEGIFKW